MSPGAPDSIEAFFLPGTSGRLFSVFHSPVSDAPTIGVLYVPPFADEMNKTRRQAALQARRLAAQGYGVMFVDLFGTGDSEGHFRDARWDGWIEDLLTAVRWLEQRGMQRIILWGVRCGALLTVDLADRLGHRVEQIILWQPVFSGKLYVGQFLRLRAAAEMMAGDGGLNTAELREQLQRGESVEIAGYDLHPDLATAIEDKDLRRMPLPADLRVDWFEILPDAEKTLSPVARQVADTWAEAGVEVALKTVVGAPFWSTPEIVVIDELLEKTEHVACRDVKDRSV